MLRRRFRPLTWGFFFNCELIDTGYFEHESFRPLTWGFFFNKTLKMICLPQTSFRPLIRGFFFYGRRAMIRCVYWFSSPHSGILFL